MPAFYPRPMGSLPLTPPTSMDDYGFGSTAYCSNPYAASSMSQAQHAGGYDYQQSYLPQSTLTSAAPPPTYPSYASQSVYPGASLPPIHSYYEPIGAPILPPLRIQDRVSFADDYHRCLQQGQHQHHQQQTTVGRDHQRHTAAAKEEKPTGGVSAKLDYEMEHMTNFVVTAVQSMYAYLHSSVCLADIDVTQSFQYHLQSEPAFIKWVHQVLSATRLPSATILLSLHFLNDRVTNRPESVTTSDNQIYRLLAVSLILGSKFLDDNTFINRSWSDVTAIKVSELNVLEMQWLRLLDYRLHVDPEASGGLKIWFDAWKKFEPTAFRRTHSSARHSPLDTHARRADRYSPYPSPFSATVSRFGDAPHSARSSGFNTPYLPADPWSHNDRSAFDDFYKRQHRYPTLTEIDDVNRCLSEERSRQSAFAYSTGSQPSYYSTPAYNSPWNQPTWSSGVHRYDCGCSACAYQAHYRPYPMASSYAAQTVMA